MTIASPPEPSAVTLADTYFRDGLISPDPTQRQSLSYFDLKNLSGGP